MLKLTSALLVVVCVAAQPGPRYGFAPGPGWPQQLPGGYGPAGHGPPGYGPPGYGGPGPGHRRHRFRPPHGHHPFGFGGPGPRPPPYGGGHLFPPPPHPPGPHPRPGPGPAPATTTAGGSEGSLFSTQQPPNDGPGPHGPPNQPPPPPSDGGSRGPRPPHHPPQDTKPGPIESDGIGSSKRVQFAIGNIEDETDELGSFSVWLIDEKMPEGSSDFSGMAVGTKPPENKEGELSGYTAGFQGMTVDTVFPQFRTCATNQSAATVANWAQTGSLDPIRGTVGSGENYQMTAGQEGYGIVSVLNPSNIYYIRKDNSEVSGTNSRDIGVINAADMAFLEEARKYLCGDYSDYYTDSTTVSSRRRKRSGDDYGFTSCAIK